MSNRPTSEDTIQFVCAGEPEEIKQKIRAQILEEENRGIHYHVVHGEKLVYNIRGDIVGSYIKHTEIGRKND